MGQDAGRFDFGFIDGCNSSHRPSRVLGGMGFGGVVVASLDGS